MNKIDTNYKLASAAIKENTDIDISRLRTFISRSDIAEKLIPYLTGEQYHLYKYAVINGFDCNSLQSNLYDVLINDMVKYTYYINKPNTVYINPSKYNSAKEINDEIQSRDFTDYSETQTDEYFCPIAIPKSITKKGICSMEEWQNSRRSTKQSRILF